MFHKKKIVWLLLLPGLAGIMLFYVVPFIGGIYYSLLDGTFENRFVGLDNYRRVLQNSMFQLGLRNTWELSLLCAPVIWLASFLLAAMLKALKEKDNLTILCISHRPRILTYADRVMTIEGGKARL